MAFKQNFKNKLYLVLVFASCCLFIYYANDLKLRTNSLTLNNTTISSNEAQLNKIPVILQWTHIYYKQTFLKREGLTTCAGGLQCNVYKNRKYFNISDAVIIHASNDDILSELPRYRLPHQKWVFFRMESPINTHLSRYGDKLNGVFNWTMTYRLDSDVPFPYGKLISKEEFNHNKNTPRITLYVMDMYLRFQKKTREVACVVSHCKTANGRLEYVRELSKYIGVDIYGACGNGNYSCPFLYFDNADCLQEIAKDYKFIIAFENSICLDYATEKLYNPMIYDIIPIVFGGWDFSKVVPLHSYIDAFQFPEPKKLADHLKVIGSSFQNYFEYFKWRKNYSDVRLFNYDYCEVCLVLHSPKRYQISVYNDIKYWWNNKSKCMNWDSKTQTFIPVGRI